MVHLIFTQLQNLYFFNTGAHNVRLMQNAAKAEVCDFTNSTYIVNPAKSDTDTVTYKKWASSADIYQNGTDTYFLACSNGMPTHCSQGMIIEVKIIPTMKIKLKIQAMKHITENTIAETQIACRKNSDCPTNHSCEAKPDSASPVSNMESRRAMQFGGVNLFDGVCVHVI